MRGQLKKLIDAYLNIIIINRQVLYIDVNNDLV